MNLLEWDMFIPLIKKREILPALVKTSRTSTKHTYGSRLD